MASSSSLVDSRPDVVRRLAIDMGSVQPPPHRPERGRRRLARRSPGPKNSDAATCQVKALANGTLGVGRSVGRRVELMRYRQRHDPDLVDTTLSGANCIAVNGSHALQVRFPTREYETTFGQALGVISFDHDAFAIAGLTRSGFGRSFRTAWGSAAGGGEGYACVKTGPGGDSEPPCDGPSTATSGTLDLALLWKRRDDTPPNECGNGWSVRGSDLATRTTRPLGWIMT